MNQRSALDLVRVGELFFSDCFLRKQGLTEILQAFAPPMPIPMSIPPMDAPVLVAIAAAPVAVVGICMAVPMAMEEDAMSMLYQC